MVIYQLVFLFVLSHIGMKSSRVLVILFAIELGANSLVTGVLISLYGLFPLVLAVYSGKVSDRFGFRYPVFFGLMGVGTGLLLPYLFPHLPALFASAALIGAAAIFSQLSFQNLIGSLGEADKRTRNYSIMSLGAAVSSFICPLIAGLFIDYLGHILAYFYLALISFLTAGGLFIYSKHIPIPLKKSEKDRKKNVADLIQNPLLRHTLISSGIVIAGVELFAFYFPIYGHRIGFSATLIGIILSLHAAASFVIRIIMPAIVKKLNEDKVLTFSLFLSGMTFLLFPLFKNAIILALISFALGLGLGCGQPLSIILTFNRAPAGRSGEALGARLTVNKFIQLTAPIFFGSIGNIFGLFPVFWGTALLLIGGGYLNPGRKGDL